MKNPSEIYTYEWMQSQFPGREEYRFLANALDEYLNPEHKQMSIVDLGCGAGLMLECFRQLGHSIFGVDGSQAALDLSPVGGYIAKLDLTKHIYGFEPADLVVCTEVAEHLEAEHADILVDNICDMAKKTIYFTAASPGQGGHDHVNEQHMHYWIEKFERHDFHPDWPASYLLREVIRPAMIKMPWYANTSMIFRRAA